MTLKEIEEQLKAAYAEPIEADGSSNFFSMLPRLHYSELPIELKEKVDETFTTEKIKAFLNDSLKENVISSLEADPKKLEADIMATIHNCIYNISFDDLGRNIIEVYLISMEFFKAWNERTQTYKAATDPGETIQEYKQFKTVKIDSIDYPTSKEYRYLFNIVPWEDKYYEEIDGQFRFTVDVKRKGEKPIDTWYTFNFSLLDDVTIAKTLTPYDKLVYTAIASLYDRGHDTVSLQMIYYAMGGTSKIGKNDKEKLIKSISKLMGTVVTINNLNEVKKHHREDYSITCNMLYAAFASEKINGQISESLLHIMKLPIMFKIAKEKKQITTFNIKLLQFPITKTDSNIQLANYLIDAILDIKRNKRNRKMLYNTICNSIGVKDRNGIYRTPEKIKKLLEHFKECGFIEGFHETADKEAVIISVKSTSEE